MTGRQRGMQDSAALKHSKKGPATRKERRRASIRGTTVTAMRKKKADKKRDKQIAKNTAARKAQKRTARRTAARKSASAAQASRSASGISRFGARYKK